MTGLRLAGRHDAIDAVVRVPGSKSVANRALVCAALVPGGGISTVEGVPDGDDCEAMMDALRICGAVDGPRIHGGCVPGEATRFDARLAGTTSRFLTAVGALSTGGVVIDGDAPLRRRPMADLHEALRSLGATVESTEGPVGSLPVRVSSSGLHGGTVGVRGDVSSQFVSALMLLGPCLEGGLVLRIEGELVSRPYVEMTARVMTEFGAVVHVDDALISVAGGSYSARTYSVEPDFSSAAFPLLSLAHGHGTVRVPSLATARLQGDSVVLELLDRMGISVRVDGSDIVAHRPHGAPVRGVDVDLRDASDLVPALAVAACAASGTTRISGIGFIRGKESDRIADLVEGLRMLGAHAEAHGDGISVTGGRLGPHGMLRTHHDHRLAMAFSMAAAGGHTVELDDGDVVSKSWPGYFEDMHDVLGPFSERN